MKSPIRIARVSLVAAAAAALICSACFSQRIATSGGDSDDESGGGLPSDAGDDDGDGSGDDESTNDQTDDGNDSDGDDTDSGDTPGDDHTSGDDDDDDDDPIGEPDATLPPFVDDCSEALNDEFSSLAGLQAVDEQLYSSVQLCSGESDWYQVNVPANSWLSVQIDIDGAGSGVSDLDLY